MPETYATFGNFLLLKKRATDGLGELWRAGEMERAGFKRIVWLRKFDGPGLDRAVLETEVGLANQVGGYLKGANIARNPSFGTEGGVPYAAWDFVPGQPLDQLLSRVSRDQYPVAIDNALLITEKISAALASAMVVEQKGEPLIHGFLIPAMVMVGNDGEAAVSGFGLARGLLANLDRVGVQEIAAPYLAPEVLTTASASRRSDVYSLGAILYHLLCGAPLPAQPAERAAVLEKPQLTLDEGPVPDDVMQILRRSLAPRPEDRYSSAADFKRDLEKLLYGGAYSPTTFNLALLMDRLYRQEIEEEDRELQREKSLDVSSYYKPPKGAAEAPVQVQAAPSSRTGLYVALGAVAVLAAVVLYLLLGRSAAPPPVDEAAQKQMLAELAQSEVARQLAEREAQLRQELEAEKAKTAEVRAQLDKLQKSATSGAQKLSPEEQARLDEAKRLLAAREAEQRRKEQELVAAQQKRAEAEAVQPKATVVPAAVPTVGMNVPTPAPTAVAAAQPTAVAATGGETRESAPDVAPTAAAVANVGLGSTVREGDLVDFTKVDTPPEVLVEERPVISRSVARMGQARGIVILRALVNEQGTVDNVEVLRGFPVPRYGVDEACVEAVKKYRFKPALKDGKKVKTWVTVTIPVDLTRTR